jgi:hypothetical protein
VVGADVVQHVPGLAQPERPDLTVGPQPVAEFRFDVVLSDLPGEHPMGDSFEAFGHRPFLPPRWGGAGVVRATRADGEGGRPWRSSRRTVLSHGHRNAPATGA